MLDKKKQRPGLGQNSISRVGQISIGANTSAGYQTMKDGQPVNTLGAKLLQQAFGTSSNTSELIYAVTQLGAASPAVVAKLNQNIDTALKLSGGVVNDVVDRAAMSALLKSGGVLDNGTPILDMRSLSTEQKRVIGELFGPQAVRQIVPDGVKLARLGSQGETGIDDLFQVNRTDVDFVKIEYKFNKSKLGKTEDGPQGSDSWFLGSGRLEKAVGNREKAREIRKAIDDGRTETWLVRTLPDGSTQVKVLDANGKVKPIDTSKIILPGKNPFGTQL